MAYPIELKEKILKLRKSGCSINELSGRFKISKSVISGWARNIILTPKAKLRLLKKIKLG